MITREELLFDRLKKKVAQTFLQDFPSSNPDISQWKGLDIIYFQEHLRQKVRGNVSEKWFYTYFKSPFEKLPRIDMLNLLAQYCGYRRGWTEFSEMIDSKSVSNAPNTDKIIEKSKKSESQNKNIIENTSGKVPDLVQPGIGKSKKRINPKIFIYVSVILFIFISVIVGVIKYYANKNTYDFCFYDADRGSLIKSRLEIVVQRQGFSPEYYVVTNGCFNYKSITDTLKMIVSSPIYKKETFVVGLKEIRENGEDNQRNFKLRPDDYAIMLYYYSTILNNTNEKQKAQLIKQRKEELNKLIADDALIYQVYDSELFGVEVLDKKKYINFMTTPTTSLKNYVLIASQTNKNNKISLIKFKIQKNEN